MLIFLLQTRELVAGHAADAFLFATFTAIVWLIWILKMALSARYRAWTQPFEVNTSVVIPVVDEPVDLFRDVLARITEQRPFEVLVVLNGARNEVLERVCEEFEGVRWTWTPVAGKRNAVRIGVELAHGDVVALVDSDTLWTTGTLSELVKPFAAADVGGVTTRQRILEPNRSFITRWADWLENSRALYAMPAQSALGQVGCLPGRTIAFRREVLVASMTEFMHGRFLGVYLEISDDRTLTNLTLQQGYRTVYQHTSLVYTDAPTQLRKLAKQQLRWARGSQYNTLRMLPWMLGHAPVLAFFFLMDVVLPFLLVGAVVGWAYRSATGTGYNAYAPILDQYGSVEGIVLVALLAIAASWLSMALRQLRHLREKPSDVLLLPLFIMFSTLFLMPIRIVGFFRMAHVASWGTRDDSDGVPVPVLPAQRTADQHTPVPVTPDGQALQPDAHPVRTPSPAPSPEATVRTPSTTGQRNPLALVPYAIGLTVFALEVLIHA